MCHQEKEARQEVTAKVGARADGTSQSIELGLEVGALQHPVAGLREEGEELVRAGQPAAREADGCRNEVLQLRSEKTMMVAELATTRESLQEHAVLRDRLQTELVVKTGRLAGVEAKLQATEQSLAGASGELGLARKQVTRLEEEQEQELVTRRSLEKVKEELMAEVEKLGARVEAEAADRQEVEVREVEQMEKLRAELEVEQARLVGQLQLCREHSAALGRSKEEFAEANSRVATTVARVGELEGKLVVLEEEKAGAVARAQAAEVQLEALKSMLAVKDTSLREMTEKLEAASEQELATSEVKLTLLDQSVEGKSEDGTKKSGEEEAKFMYDEQIRKDQAEKVTSSSCTQLFDSLTLIHLNWFLSS